MFEKLKASRFFTWLRKDGGQVQSVETASGTARSEAQARSVGAVTAKAATRGASRPKQPTRAYASTVSVPDAEITAARLEARTAELKKAAAAERQAQKAAQVAQAKRESELRIARDERLASLAAQRERVRLSQLPAPKFFANLEADPERVVHYGTYHPYWGGSNPNFDHFSGQILDLKKGYPSAIERFATQLHGVFGSHFTLVIVPSHDPAKRDSGVRALATAITQRNPTIALGADCIVRSTKVAKLATGGNRSQSVHTNSMSLDNLDLIRGKHVMVLDDVTTSGNSLLACRKLLMDAGAKEVQLYAVAQTN